MLKVTKIPPELIKKRESDTKCFVYLSDGVMERKYVIAEIRLGTKDKIIVIEVERNDKALSTLIYIIDSKKPRNYHLIIEILIYNRGTPNKKQLNFYKTKLLTLRHDKTDFFHKTVSE